MKLAKKLSEWEQIKLIDEKQKSAILAYESRQGKTAAVYFERFGRLLHRARHSFPYRFQLARDSRQPEAERGHFITGVDSSRGLSFL